MLNPSTADAVADDPTIRRCTRFGREAGYGGVLIGNLFAWRASDPTELLEITEPVGPDNDVALAAVLDAMPTVVCAWGNRGTYLNRGLEVLGMFARRRRVPYCLKMTQMGHPAHPLYLSSGLRPIPWRYSGVDSRG